MSLKSSLNSFSQVFPTRLPNIHGSFLRGIKQKKMQRGRHQPVPQKEEVQQGEKSQQLFLNSHLRPRGRSTKGFKKKEERKENMVLSAERAIGHQLISGWDGEKRNSRKSGNRRALWPVQGHCLGYEMASSSYANEGLERHPSSCEREKGSPTPNLGAFWSFVRDNSQQF